MEMDPEGFFREYSDDENDFNQEKESTKEFIVYLIDASPKMFAPLDRDLNKKNETHFHVALASVVSSLKNQIISHTYDEVAICFFNTKEKKNLQDLNGVYVFNVNERDFLDRPTARLIKEFDCINDSVQRFNLFRIRGTVKGKVYKIVAENGSIENLIFGKVVKMLTLSIEDQLEPCTIG